MDKNDVLSFLYDISFNNMSAQVVRYKNGGCYFSQRALSGDIVLHKSRVCVLVKVFRYNFISLMKLKCNTRFELTSSDELVFASMEDLTPLYLTANAHEEYKGCVPCSHSDNVEYFRYISSLLYLKDSPSTL